MSDLDQIHRFLLDHSDIRGEITSLNKSYQQATAHQFLPQTAKTLLGQFLAGAVLLGETLKFNGVLTLQARGEGAISLIMAEVTSEGHLRGVVKLKPSHQSGYTELVDQSLPELIGKGVLSITVDPDEGERYQGIVPLEGETLADCLNDYFFQSEQLPTQVYLFADDKHSGGLLLQCLPAKIILDEQEREKRWQTATYLASTISANELYSLKHESLLYRLFHELHCRIFPGEKIVFKCQCTLERCENAVLSLGKEQVYQLLKEKKVIESCCQFCGKDYRFDREDVDRLFGKPKKTLH